MGYNNDIFEEQVDDELRCPICDNVLENPMQGIECEHLFCKECILQWLKSSLFCPLDHKQLLPSQLQQPPNIILKLLNNLKIKCNYYGFGCSTKLKLGDLNEHNEICAFNPSTNPILCQNKLTFNNGSSENEMKNFRIAGNLSNQIDKISEIVNGLNQDLELENRKSMEYAKNLEQAQLNYEKLNQKFKRIIDPFLSLIETTKQSNEDRKDDSDILTKRSKQSDDDLRIESQQTCTAIIRNLNEFLNEQIVEEYLRQNGIPILNCELELSVFKRSRDFKVNLEIFE